MQLLTLPREVIEVMDVDEKPLEIGRRSWPSFSKCIRTFVHAFEPSAQEFRAEGSNKRSSPQHFRSILQPIYHFLSEG